VLKEDPRIAYEAVTKVWQPEAAWRRLIEEQLRKHKIAFEPSRNGSAHPSAPRGGRATSMNFWPPCGRVAQCTARGHYPPSTPQEFRAYLKRMRLPENRGFLVCERGTRGLVGVINLSNVVLGLFAAPISVTTRSQGSSGAV
jgi:hypothetical protein